MNIAVYIILFFVVRVAPKTRKHKKGDVLPEVWNDIAYQYLEREGNNPTCQGCSKVRQYLGLPEFNVTDLRIEMAKQNILNKLGLENAPSVQQNQKASLPHPILDVFKQDKERKPLKNRRSSTEQVMVMASDITCSPEPTGNINLKFSFEIPERIRRSQISSAALWLYTDTRSELYKFSNCLLTTKTCGLPSNIKSKEISVKSKDNIAGWIKNDVIWWMQGKENCQRFKLSCSGDAQIMFNCSHYNEATKKPFLMIEETSDDSLEMFREKRNVNCVDGVHECCREKLYVSFADIGWGDWIIQPKGYEAYYCKGTCINAAAISLSATAYHSVLKKLFLTKGSLEITPCCTPTRLSPVQLIYMDQNGTFIQKTIQDLTVDSCGCM